MHAQSLSCVWFFETPGSFLLYNQGFCGSSAGKAGKESTCNAEDPSSIPGLGRSAGEGVGYPFQYSGLENSMDCIVHGFIKSQKWLGDFHFTSLCDSTDCSPPSSSVHGILQARIMVWVAISSSRGSSRPRDGTHVSCVSCIGRQIFFFFFLTTSATWEAQHGLKATVNFFSFIIALSFSVVPRSLLFQKLSATGIWFSYVLNPLCQVL